MNASKSKRKISSSCNANVASEITLGQNKFRWLQCLVNTSVDRPQRCKEMFLGNKTIATIEINLDIESLEV